MQKGQFQHLKFAIRVFPECPKQRLSLEQIKRGALFFVVLCAKSNCVCARRDNSYSAFIGNEKDARKLLENGILRDSNNAEIKFSSQNGMRSVLCALQANQIE